MKVVLSNNCLILDEVGFLNRQLERPRRHHGHGADKHSCCSVAEERTRTHGPFDAALPVLARRVSRTRPAGPPADEYSAGVVGLVVVENYSLENQPDQVRGVVAAALILTLCRLARRADTNAESIVILPCSETHRQKLS